MRTTPHTVTVETLRSYLARGFVFVEADSTDDRLLLALTDGETEVHLALDRDGAGELFRDPELIQGRARGENGHAAAAPRAQSGPQAPQRNL